MVKLNLVQNLILFHQRRDKAIGITFNTEFTKGLMLFALSLQYAEQAKYLRADFLNEYSILLAKNLRDLISFALTTDEENRKIVFEKVQKLTKIYEKTINELEELAKCQQ